MNKDEQQEREISVPVPYENDLKKSNLLIGAKYKATLTELRITYASLYYLQSGMYKEEPDGLVVSFSGSELKKMLNVNGNSFYEVLEPVAKIMTNRSLGWSDPQSHEFEYISLITKAKYANSTFTVKFNSDMKDYLINLQSDFTPLSRITMMNFSSAYSFRLYELLKKQCYYPKNYKGTRDNVFSVNVGLSELKFEMGVANADLDIVRRILTSGGKTPDYDTAIEKSPEKIKSYSVWGNFRARCLDKAITEINEITDIYVTYDAIRKGRGGKVFSISFTVYLDGAEDLLNAESSINNAHDVIPVTLEDGEIKAQLDVNEKFPIWVKVNQIFEEEHLSFVDVQTICEEAAYDVERIQHAHDLMKQSRTKIDRVTGWIIACIRNGYESGVSYEPNQVKSKNKFNNFNQREYDYDEYEKMVLTTSVPK